jgi:hypothetical protein
MPSQLGLGSLLVRFLPGALADAPYGRIILASVMPLPPSPGEGSRESAENAGPYIAALGGSAARWGHAYREPVFSPLSR